MAEGRLQACVASGKQHRQRCLADRHDVDRRSRLKCANDLWLPQRSAHERTGIDRLQRRTQNGCQVVTKLGKCFQ